MMKRASVLVGAVIAVVILALSYLQTIGSEKQRSVTDGRIAVEESPTKLAEKAAASSLAESTATVEENPIKVSDIEGIVPGGNIHVKVTKIVDGDTIHAEYKSEDYKVRLLCIDTPETVKAGVSEQPYGKKASEKLRGMLLNKQVILLFEKDLYDHYDRLLAYVILKDDTCVNALMVEQGYARVDVVRPNSIHKDYFYKLQEEAIRNKMGLWSLPVNKRPFIKNDKGYYVPKFYDDAA